MKHFKKHHKGFPPGFEDAKIYICDECPEEFLTPYNLANHKTAVHKFRDEKFVCDICKLFCNVPTLPTEKYN